MMPAYNAAKTLHLLCPFGWGHHRQFDSLQRRYRAGSRWSAKIKIR